MGAVRSSPGPTAPGVAASPSSHAVVLTLLVPPTPRLELALFTWSPGLSGHSSPSAQSLSLVPLSGSPALAPSSHCGLPETLSPLRPIHPAARAELFGENGSQAFPDWKRAGRRVGGSDQTRMLPSTLCTSGLTRAQGGQDTPPSGPDLPNSFLQLSLPSPVQVLSSLLPLHRVAETQGLAPPGFHFYMTPSQQTLRPSRCNNTAQGEALPQC